MLISSQTSYPHIIESHNSENFIFHSNPVIQNSIEKFIALLAQGCTSLDTRVKNSKLLLSVLAKTLKNSNINGIGKVAESLNDIFELIDNVKSSNPKQHIADEFNTEFSQEKFNTVYKKLSLSLATLSRTDLEEFTTWCIKFNHCLNIASEVERLSRTKNSGSFSKIYQIAKDNNILLEELDDFVSVQTATAHPNRFMSLVFEKTYGVVIDELLKGDENSNPLSSIWTLFNTEIIPKEKPKRSEEASYISRTISESVLYAISETFRADLKARREIYGEDASYPSYSVHYNMWPTFDWDGQQNPTGDETKYSTIRNRELACKFLSDKIIPIIAKLPEHIAFEFEGSQINCKALMSRFSNRLRDLQGANEKLDKVTKDRLLSGVDAIIYAIQHSSDWKLDRNIYQGLVDDLAEIRFISNSIGVHLVSGEHRQNSQVNENALDQISALLGAESYSKLKEDEKLNLLTFLLNSPEKIVEISNYLEQNFETLSKDIKEVFDVLSANKLLLESDSNSISRSIISLTTSASDILEVELLLKLAGINLQNSVGDFTGPTLEIVPLFERPEDKLLADKIFRYAYEKSPTLKNLIAKNNRVSIMIGYSDGQMRGGPGDRELSRYVEKVMSKFSNSIGYKCFAEHGIGPGVGRGGGYNGDQSMLTDEAVESKYSHMTIQGTAIGKLLRVSSSAARQINIALKNFLDGLLRTKNPISDEQKKLFDTLRWSSYEKAREKYVVLTRRGEQIDFCGKKSNGEDIFFATFGLIFPPDFLSGLNQVSRPLFRFKSGGQKTFFNGLQDNPNIWAPYEDFRAVPNSQISDGSRLCFLSIYGWGEILNSIRQSSNDDTLGSMYENDRAFQADVNGLLLSLQSAAVPFSLALYRAQYGDYKDKPLVKELFRVLDLIEADYKLLLDCLAPLEPAISDRVKRTNKEIRFMRGLKDPSTYAMQILRGFITVSNHKRFENQSSEVSTNFEDWEYANLARLLSVGIGIGQDNAS